jgi:hypothetical protein
LEAKIHYERPLVEKSSHKRYQREVNERQLTAKRARLYKFYQGRCLKDGADFEVHHHEPYTIAFGVDNEMDVVTYINKPKVWVGRMEDLMNGTFEPRIKRTRRRLAVLDSVMSSPPDDLVLLSSSTDDESEQRVIMTQDEVSDSDELDMALNH